jgi:signal transduction histidine kinase
MATKKPEKKVSDPRSDFANLASHQLRTPLSGTKWMLELLENSDKGNLSAKQKEYIEKIYASNERMIALVNDLLEVSRIEQGGMKLYLQPTDLGHIIRSLVKEKAKEVKKKKLQISLTVEEEPFPPVSSELNKIRQALNNIISNAITYTPAGGKIEIDLKVQDGEALGRVTDTGFGIPVEQQKQIFSKFFRGSNILSVETSGTGLGLYISKSFIEASGGKLWFKSEEGKGTSFYFTLPLAK